MNLCLIEPICCYNRMLCQVELYMSEMYNKAGIGLITWSPVSFGLCDGKPEEQLELITKLAIKVKRQKQKHKGNGKVAMLKGKKATAKGKKSY